MMIRVIPSSFYLKVEIFRKFCKQAVCEKRWNLELFIAKPRKTIKEIDTT